MDPSSAPSALRSASGPKPPRHLKAESCRQQHQISESSEKKSADVFKSFNFYFRKTRGGKTPSFVFSLCVSCCFCCFCCFRHLSPLGPVSARSCCSVPGVATRRLEDVSSNVPIRARGAPMHLPWQRSYNRVM